MSTQIKIEGLVYKLGALETKTDKFSVRKIVLETLEDNPDYAQFLEIQFVNDRADSLDFISQGDKVLVTLSLRGREWKAPDGTIKFFNTLNGESIQRREASKPIGGDPLPEAPSSDPFADPFSSELFNVSPSGSVTPNI